MLKVKMHFDSGPVKARPFFDSKTCERSVFAVVEVIFHLFILLFILFFHIRAISHQKMMDQTKQPSNGASSMNQNR